MNWRVLLVLLAVTCCLAQVQRKLVTFNSIPAYTGTKPNQESYTGYLKVREQDNGYLFYWFFPGPSVNAPLVLWLNGGPGCTSLFGVLQESGPFRLVSTTNLTDNAASWTKTANMLFIDNPVGVPYSFIDDINKAPSTAIAAAKDLVTGLRLWFSAGYFPEYKNNDMYLFGESYGGKYVTALATEVITNPLANFNVKGIALGNAWVSPDIQESVYGPMGYTVGIMGYANMLRINNDNKRCHELIELDRFVDADKQSCAPAWMETVRAGGGFNAYDYRLIGRYPFMDVMSQYMRRLDVMSALGVPTSRRPDDTCSFTMFDNFLVEFQKDYIDFLPAILQRMKVLVYNGNFDLRCNVRGTDEWLRRLQWDGRAGFNNMQHSVWYVNGESSGIFRTFKNLTQLVIYNAGHLVPFDQPANSQDMMAKFVNGANFCQAPNTQCGTTQCPASCSNQGKCDTSTGVCTCAAGFSGDDCSVGVMNMNFGKARTFDGFMYGRSVNYYQITLTDLSPTFDLNLQVLRISPYGNVHLYVHLGNSTIVPNDKDIDTLRRQYRYQVLEDVEKKSLSLTSVDGTAGNVLNVALLSTLDTETDYSLSINTALPGARADMGIVFSLTTFGLLAGVAVLLLVIAIAQFVADSRKPQ